MGLEINVKLVIYCVLACNSCSCMSGIALTNYKSTEGMELWFVFTLINLFILYQYYLWLQLCMNNDDDYIMYYVGEVVVNIKLFIQKSNKITITV